MSRPQPSTRKDYGAFVPLQTRWADNDEYGHLNNATYLSLFDTALSLWQLQNGIPIRGPDAFRFLMVESGCRYHAEIQFPDQLTAGLKVGQLGNSSYRMDIGLFRNLDDSASAEGFFVQVLVNASGQAYPIPPQVRSTLSTLLNRP